MPMFRDRIDAGRRLADALVHLEGEEVVVLGVPRGGVEAAALRWARAGGGSRVVLAVPVAPREAVARLSKEADEVVTLATPEPFFAVGQWYEQFPQTADDEVVQLLERG